MFGGEAATLIPFIFTMPFLAHPVVFFIFGKAMHHNEEVPKTAALTIAQFVSLINSDFFFTLIMIPIKSLKGY